MKIALNVIMGLVLLVVLTACNKVEQGSQFNKFAKYDKDLVVLAQKINTASDENEFSLIDQKFDILSPIDQGRVIDIVIGLDGISDDNVSVEVLQTIAVKDFGVGMDELDEESQLLVLKSAGIDSVANKQVRGNCALFSYNGRGVTYKKSKKRAKRYYATGVNRVVNSPGEWFCDFEITFAKSGRDYVYASHWLVRRALKKAQKRGSGKIATRNSRKNILIGYGAAKKAFYGMSSVWIEIYLKNYTYLWKNK